VSRRPGGDPFYDSLLAKVVVWGQSREAATARMARPDTFELEGVQSLIPVPRRLLATEQWQAAETCRDLVGDKGWLKQAEPA
jgi:acetyl/propionyl-CoA carboxylase alpha subunit